MSQAEATRGRRPCLGTRFLTSRAFRAVAPRAVPPFHRFVARLTGGRTLLDSDRAPLLLLHTTGARSGEPRETPLAAVVLDDDRFYVVGSNFARERHPAWTANLLAHPHGEVTFRGQRSAVTARLLSEAERGEAWPTLLRVFPAWERYTSVTDRPFRVFELTLEHDGGDESSIIGLRLGQDAT